MSRWNSDDAEVEEKRDQVLNAFFPTIFPTDDDILSRYMDTCFTLRPLARLQKANIKNQT